MCGLPLTAAPVPSRGLCSHVIRSEMVRTGWQQVAVVYLAMGQLVRQLRQQELPNLDRRESQYTRYAGTYMQDVGLQRWIVAQGGMVREERREEGGGGRERGRSGEDGVVREERWEGEEEGVEWWERKVEEWWEEKGGRGRVDLAS